MWNPIGQSLRALAPFNDAVALARRMARQYAQHRAAGGAARAAAAAYVVPDDVDVALVVAAVEKKLHNGGGPGARRAMAPFPLQIDQDGRAVVPAELVERLGNGNAGRGRRLLDRVVSDIRQGRVLARLGQHDAAR